MRRSRARSGKGSARGKCCLMGGIILKIKHLWRGACESRWPRHPASPAGRSLPWGEQRKSRVPSPCPSLPLSGLRGEIHRLPVPLLGVSCRGAARPLGSRDGRWGRYEPPLPWQRRGGVRRARPRRCVPHRPHAAPGTSAGRRRAGGERCPGNIKESPALEEEQRLNTNNC